MKKKSYSRIYILLVIIISISSNIFGALHLKGSLEWPFTKERYRTHYIPIIKIKQDLIKRNGLMWYLKRPIIPTAYLLRDSINCGLLILESDSAIAHEIKTSIDLLSAEGDTICVPYIYAFYGPNDPRFFSKKRFFNDQHYRDSLYIETALLGRRFANLSNRGDKCWFISDTSLYYTTECFRLYESGTLFEVINLYPLKVKYREECNRLGYSPMYDEIGYTLPDSLTKQDAVNNPEIQLLYKYMKINDSIILNSSFNGKQYDLNVEYDHKKLSNSSPLFFKYQKWDSLKGKLQKPTLE